MFCNHDWAPRTGMDSGSYCLHCFATTTKECIPGSGLSSGVLLTHKDAPPKPPLFKRLMQVFQTEV